MTCIRNYDQSTGIYSQVYTYDFLGTNDKLPTIQIPYHSQTIKKNATKKKGVVSTESWLVALRKKTIIISTTIHQSQYPTSATHLSKRTIVPVLLQPFRKYFSPACPLLVLSTPKHTTYFRIYKTDLNMKTHFKTTRGKGLRIPSRTTTGGSSPFPWSVSEVDAALRLLSALPIGTEEASTAPP